MAGFFWGLCDEWTGILMLLRGFMRTAFWPILAVLPVIGCSSLGPGVIPRDRTEYLSSAADSWKEQTLLNAVRFRYGDAPSFLDVSSVVSSYAFQG